ncbi:MAG: LptF/LptG family permease, partial [Bacteroidaceae bacterium]|nr:LptF/LptG family permease [Bacteroidaceae bacterium]
YIVFQTISATFAINGNMPPIVAVWIPNIMFLIIGIYLYWKAPK